MSTELYDDGGRYLGKDRPDTAPLDDTPVESFEDFWDEYSENRAPRPSVDIFGQLVEVPSDLPLAVELDVDQLQSSSNLKDIKHLVAEIFGADVLDAWVDARMTGHQFQVVLMWGMSNGRGQDMSFAEAAAAVKKAEAEAAARNAEGKAEPVPMNRAARRAARTRGRRSVDTGP